jgi:hypothetical protein
MKIITGFPWIYVYIFHGKLYGTDTSKHGSQIHGYSSSGFRDSMIWLGVTQTEPSPIDFAFLRASPIDFSFLMTPTID